MQLIECIILLFINVLIYDLATGITHQRKVTIVPLLSIHSVDEERMRFQE